MKDPVKVLERRQEGSRPQSCHGCIHLFMQKSDFDKRQVLICAKGLTVGERCKLFQEKL